MCPIRSKKWNKKNRNETQPTLSTKTTVTHWAQTKGPGTWRGKALQPEQWLFYFPIFCLRHNTCVFSHNKGEKSWNQKKDVNSWKAPQRSFTPNIPDEKSKARGGQVTCPRYLYQGQKQDKKDSSEQAEKGRDSLEIDWESHSHSTSKNKRRIFFLKAKNNEVSFSKNTAYFFNGAHFP